MGSTQEVAMMPKKIVHQKILEADNLKLRNYHTHYHTSHHATDNVCSAS